MICHFRQLSSHIRSDILWDIIGWTNWQLWLCFPPIKTKVVMNVVFFLYNRPPSQGPDPINSGQGNSQWLQWFKQWFFFPIIVQLFYLNRKYNSHSSWDDSSSGRKWTKVFQNHFLLLVIFWQNGQKSPCFFTNRCRAIDAVFAHKTQRNQL